MDKEIDEKEFIQNFALELTNRTLEQRKEIGKKYYKQLKRLQAENEQLKTDIAIYTGIIDSNKEENERLKLKVQDVFNGDISVEEVTPIYRCHHVEDNKYYPTLKDVQFDETSEYILIENPNSCYGFSALWLKDRKNKIYEYDGFGHSGASSVVCSLLQKLIKEQTNEKRNDR